MGRKILFITTDQQRYDALGCNGGKVARTPVIDGWAKAGINYARAHCQSVVCMPSRATMVTGQHVRSHGVWMNGVPLPVDAPSVAAYLHERAGYRTALIGKAHFEPMLDLQFKFYENRMARAGEFGPHRGFDHMELSGHVARGFWHYSVWMMQNHPGEVDAFFPLIIPGRFEQNSAGGGDTGAVQVKHNPIRREHYHTDWVADRTIAYLDSLDPADDWFVWMSFPDPHHPWDPPASELGRVNWRDLDLPAFYPGSWEKIEAILAQKPRHWLDWYKGRTVTTFEAPPDFVPERVTPDQIREITALIHIENELVDEACGRVWRRIVERGWEQDTDIIYTTDHGELQGDFGLLFKGPHHVDSLMRLPLIWKPAASAGVPAAAVAAPVGHVDLAPTFCAIAGLPAPDWMQGQALPQHAAEAAAQRRERVITEWDSEFKGLTIRLRSIYRDGHVCTAYEKSSLYDGSEGELYDLRNDPQQWRNLWSDAAYGKLKSDLLADLRDHLPPPREPPIERYANV
jgi:arylsulfatase A-like enzyme